jgi:hypothetical protein
MSTAATDSNIKTVKVIKAQTANTSSEGNGNAALDTAIEMGATQGGATNTRKKGSGAKGSRKNKKVFELGSVTKLGGGSTSPGTAVQLAASHVPGVPGAVEPVGVNSPATQKGAPAGGGKAAAPAATPVKVVLAAPKKKKPGVVLAAAHVAKPPVASTSSTKVGGGGVTRKASHKARKIKVSMKTLRKKIHKAKTIRQSAEGASLEQIKKELQKAGLLKPDSKAPETMLRQMYADFMTLKGRAL